MIASLSYGVDDVLYVVVIYVYCGIRPWLPINEIMSTVYSSNDRNLH